MLDAIGNRAKRECRRLGPSAAFCRPIGQGAGQIRNLADLSTVRLALNLDAEHNRSHH
jgi:hypothetical protein